MRALITGGSGFVGRALRVHLDAAGDDVVATDRASGGPDVCDRDAVFDHVAAHEVDVVYHLAAQAHVPTSWTDPIGTLRTNVEGTLNVIDAAAERPGTRVIAVTSGEIYGALSADELPVSETAPLRPCTPYAASKAAADVVALQAFLGRGLDVVRARAFNHLGPGQHPSFVAAALARRIALAEREGTTEIPIGNLTARRDFTDVRDVARAYRLLALHGQPGAAYNVCSGLDRSIAELADGLLDRSVADLRLVTDPELVRPVDVPVVRGDASLLSAETGWQPEIGIETSLADILDDARTALDG